jgi:glycosyltransferase involved in cell wall biosynthesis
MEVIACGTPVIGSIIDGLPSTIGPAGTVIRPGSASVLADVILRYAQDMQLQMAWREGCLRQREAMLDWDAVTERWEAVLRG